MTVASVPAKVRLLESVSVLPSVPASVMLALAASVSWAHASGRVAGAARPTCESRAAALKLKSELDRRQARERDRDVPRRER